MKYLRLLSYTGLILIVTMVFNFSFAAGPKRMALLPFKINAQKDLSFLRDGIYDMLATRLAEEGQVEVIERPAVEAAIKSAALPGPMTEQAARKIGAELKADFILYGSLTVLGHNVSIDAKTVDVSGARPTMSFFNESPTLGGIISRVDGMAADINRRVFGRVMASQKAPAVPPAAANPSPSQPKTPTTNLRVHPEKLLNQEGFISEQPGQRNELEIVGSERVRRLRQKFWKSANFKHLINGVALGDVDGDGRIETVVATPRSVIVYRAAAGRFQKIAEIADMGSIRLISVDVGDINDNGKAEIFVSALNAKKNVVTSLVLEFDGQNFVRIAEDTPWLYRVVQTPARGEILLGQRSRVGNPYSGGIHELHWQGDEYAPGDVIKTPRQTCLLGLTIGDVLNNEQETVVTYKPNDELRVLGATGKTLWSGSERYGGSMLYVSGPMREQGDHENMIYLPLRLLVWRAGSDRDSVVITAKNYDLSGRKLEYRKLTKAEFVALTWDGIGLVPTWKTRQISGYIQDFAVGDFDNDGRPELVAAVVIKEGRVILTGEPKTTLIAYELGGLQKAGAQTNP